MGCIAKTSEICTAIGLMLMPDLLGHHKFPAVFFGSPQPAAGGRQKPHVCGASERQDQTPTLQSSGQGICLLLLKLYEYLFGLQEIPAHGDFVLLRLHL